MKNTWWKNKWEPQIATTLKKMKRKKFVLYKNGIFLLILSRKANRSIGWLKLNWYICRSGDSFYIRAAHRLNSTQQNCLLFGIQAVYLACSPVSTLLLGVCVYVVCFASHIIYTVLAWTCYDFNDVLTHATWHRVMTRRLFAYSFVLFPICRNKQNRLQHSCNPHSCP